MSTGPSPDSGAEGCPHTSHSVKNSPSLPPPSSGLRAEQTGPARQDFPGGLCSTTACGLTPGRGASTHRLLELWAAGQGGKSPWGRGGNAHPLQRFLWGLRLHGYCSPQVLWPEETSPLWFPRAIRFIPANPELQSRQTQPGISACVVKSHFERGARHSKALRHPTGHRPNPLCVFRWGTLPLSASSPKYRDHLRTYSSQVRSQTDTRHRINVWQMLVCKIITAHGNILCQYRLIIFCIYSTMCHY